MEELVHSKLKTDQSLVDSCVLNEVVSDDVVDVIVGDVERQKGLVLRKRLSDLLKFFLCLLLTCQVIVFKIENLQSFVNSKSLGKSSC